MARRRRSGGGGGGEYVGRSKKYPASTSSLKRCNLRIRYLEMKLHLSLNPKP